MPLIIFSVLIFYGKVIQSNWSKMAVAAENGAPKTELQELQMKSNQVTDEVTSWYFFSLCY